MLARHSDSELLLHAGDHAEDVIKHKDIPVRAVCGNCDDPRSAAAEELFDLFGVQVLLVHGHKFRVKETPLPLLFRAKEIGAQIVIYGHSHVPVLAEEDGIILLNPGSLSYPRGGFSTPSYALMDLRIFGKTTEVAIQHLDLSGKPIKGFSLKKVFSKT